MLKYRTDYPGHDALYRDRKAKGFMGWDDDQQWRVWREEIERLIADPMFPQSGSILELGSGAGDAALLFAARGYSVTGVEISPTAVEWAKEKTLARKLSTEFVVGDVTNLQALEDDTFDAVIDGHCLHCIIGEDRSRVLAESYRVLKPDGLFYVNTMCGEPDEPEVAKVFDSESRCIIVDGIARRYLGRPGDILHEIEACGFRLERHEVRTGQGKQGDLVVFARKKGLDSRSLGNDRG